MQTKTKTAKWGRRMTIKLKEGHIIEYRTVLGDPGCLGRKYEEEPWECTSKEDS